MNPYSVYLAGFMSEKKLKETTEWRLRVRDFYVRKGWPIVFLDPWNGKEVATVTDNGLKSSVPGKALVDRDYSSVKTSDIVIANLDTFGEERPPVGTLSEIVWAWTLKKPVILISNVPHYVYHPFLKEFSSWIVDSVDTLLKDRVLDYFFKGVHGAVYTPEDIITMRKDEFK